MSAWRGHFLLGMALLAAAGCGRYVERERETGHRGAARLNPFLAAELFLGELGHEVEVVRRWPSPGRGDALLVMPAGMLGAEGFVREAVAWVRGGGHLVCLFAHPDASVGDWAAGAAGGEAEVSRAWRDWLRGEAGVEVLDQPLRGTARRVVVVAGEAFEVTRTGGRRFGRAAGRDGGGPPRSLLSFEHGRGRVTLVSDARAFRNRFLGEAENASLLAWLAGLSRPGTIRFVHGSGVSLWAMLWRHGWPLVVGALVWLWFWLWRSLPRFGPCEDGVAADPQRDYTGHLQAVGGYYWRYDRGVGLLGALRREGWERLQRRRAAAGGAGEDPFALAEAISGVPRERVRQALTEVPRPDPAQFTRVTADLQQLLLTL